MKNNIKKIIRISTFIMSIILTLVYFKNKDERINSQHLNAGYSKYNSIDLEYNQFHSDSTAYKIDTSTMFNDKDGVSYCFKDINLGECTLFFRHFKDYCESCMNIHILNLIELSENIGNTNCIKIISDCDSIAFNWLTYKYENRINFFRIKKEQHELIDFNAEKYKVPYFFIVDKEFNLKLISILEIDDLDINSTIYQDICNELKANEKNIIRTRDQIAYD